GVVLGHAVVAPKRVGAAYQQLPDLTVRNRVALIVDEEELVIRADGAADRLVAHLRRVVQPREAEQPLGHAEDLLDAAGREEIPGQASGKLCPIGSVTSRQSSGRMSFTAAAAFVL